MIKVKILADSITHHKYRLTTFELEYPKFIHPQLLTHREFARNAQSSRAIPTNKLIKRVLDNPAIPMKWGLNQKGMQAHKFVNDEQTVNNLKKEWLNGLDDAIARIGQLEIIAGTKIHKQTINRLIEPWSHIKVILSGCSFNNFFHLRLSHEAQPEIMMLTKSMLLALQESVPNKLSYFKQNDVHLPLVTSQEKEQLDINTLKKISVGRCARVSYLTHNGKRDIEEDIRLHDDLKRKGHWSPFEHIASPMFIPLKSGCFIGWKQYRKEFKTEYFS